MNDRPPQLRFTQVLVPLAQSSGGHDARHALAAGIAIATAVGARLAGLFVEDVRLVRVSALPFAQEVGSLTAATRLLEAGDVERALRVEASHLQRLLAEQALRARVDFSFEVARGELLAEALARSADLTLVCGAEPAPHRGPRSLHMTTPAPSRGTPGALPAHRPRVLALYDESPPGRRGAAAAVQVARSAGADLLLLVAPASPATAKAARTRLAAEGLPGQVVELSLTAPTLRWLARLHQASALAVPLAAPASDAIDVAALAADPPCTLVLVR